ncbi:MAG: hypothetical protein HDQ97_14250 [Lachnospiraceae bacterium]|nr:hypothetical protein [Lachnospiraceae bacterium]
MGDVVILDYYRVRGRHIFSKGHIENDAVITRMKYAEYMMKAPANFYFGVLWNKFFKADIIRKFGLFCSPELNTVIDLYKDNRIRIQMFYLSFAHDKIKKNQLECVDEFECIMDIELADEE